MTWPPETAKQFYGNLAEKELKNCARTPQPLFDALHAEFGFTFDAAATRWDTKLERFNSPWDAPFPWSKDERPFSNPPWGWVGQWVKLAHDSCTQSLCFSVQLVPAGVNSKWFRNYGWRAQVRLFERRPAFDPPPGLEYSVPHADAMLLIWDPGQLTNSRDRLQVSLCNALGQRLS